MINNPKDEIKLSSNREDHLKKEYDKLNKEIENLLAEIRSRERYSLTIIAGISAWVFTNLCKTNGLLILAVSIIPFMTTLAYGVSVKYLYKNINWIGLYLRKIEDHFLEEFKDKNGFPFGWEKYFDTVNKKEYVNVTKGIWFFQILMTIILISFVLTYKFNA